MGLCDIAANDDFPSCSVSGVTVSFMKDITAPMYIQKTKEAQQA
jgi:hypothetical protein